MKSSLYPVLFGGYKPALDLNFLNGVLDGRITASGGANGTRVNSSGVIVAATTPRFDYDPVSLAARGVLVEEARTNLLLNSAINGTSLATQSVTVTAVPHTLSFYGTGTVTLSGASTAGPLVGSGAYPTRSTLTFTPAAGSLTLTVSGTVQYANLEAGSFASSFIPSGGSATTRTADSLTMTGSNFSQWFNATQGTFVTEGDTLTVSGARTLFAISDGTSSNLLRLFGRSGGSFGAQVTSGGITQLDVTPAGTYTVGGAIKGALAATSGDFSAVYSGGAVTSGVGSVPVSPNQIRIGATFDGSTPINGHVKTLRYYPRRLPNATLQALTQ